MLAPNPVSQALSKVSGSGRSRDWAWGEGKHLGQLQEKEKKNPRPGLERTGGPTGLRKGY